MVKKIGKDISKAIKLLNKGEVVAIPTETVYGLASNALNEKAVLKIFSIKNRPSFDPLIIHTDFFYKIKPLIKNIPDKAKILAKKFWPGPLTILLEKSDLIPDIVTSGLSTVGIRIPNHPLTLSLLEKLDYPLAAPSANPFGYISPTNAKHVNDQLGNKIEYILDGGECSIGLESTIIGFETSMTGTNYTNKIITDNQKNAWSNDDSSSQNQEKIVIYRLGGISIENIENEIGKVEIQNKGSNPKSPGMLDNHYAPKIPLYFGDIESMLEKFKNKKIAIISFYKNYQNEFSITSSFSKINIIKNFILSNKKDLKEAAHNLFSSMRKADNLNIDLILAEKFPNKGLGMAINDRLLRASIH